MTSDNLSPQGLAGGTRPDDDAALEGEYVVSDDGELMPIDAPTTHLSQELINEFVVAAHFDFDKVKSMLAERYELLNENAAWLETPIQAAAHTGRADIAEFLLEQGAPLDICTAAMLGRADDVRQMLNDDPGLYEAVGAHNIPVMYFPAIAGNIPIATMLLSAGAAINVEDGRSSPLHGAASFGQTEMVKWLLANDANPYTVDFDGKTPLERAQQRQYTAIIELLQPFFPVEEGGTDTGEAQPHEHFKESDSMNADGQA